jgi:hypothetical protein
VLFLALALTMTCRRETPAPAPAPAPAKRILSHPKSLVIQLDDLPRRFPMAGGEPKGENEFSQVYFDPRVVQDDAAEPALFGVIANLAVLEDAAAAARRFDEQGGLDAPSILRDLQKQSPNARTPSAEEYAIALDGADRIAGFRAHYVLEQSHVFEYRFRLRVENVLSNLIISARGTTDGQPPAELEPQARRIAERQVHRLQTARNQPP